MSEGGAQTPQRGTTGFLAALAFLRPAQTVKQKIGAVDQQQDAPLVLVDPITEQADGGLFPFQGRQRPDAADFPIQTVEFRLRRAFIFQRVGRA